MTARRRSTAARMRLGIAMLAGVAASVAACVEIASGPDGAQSVRFAPLVQAIIAGDVLRDSTGAPAPVRAVAFDEGGNEITTTGFRYFVLPLVRDTSTASPPLVIDSLTGVLRALATPTTAQARVGARLGDRLQLLDTLAIVRRPTRLVRSDSTTQRRVLLPFLCNDTARTPRVDTTFLASASPPLGVTVTGDSGGTTVPVPGWLVRYRIVQPTSVPSGRLPSGETRDAFYPISGAGDRPLRFDTTNAQGTTATRLRLQPLLFPQAVFRDSVLDVGVEATAIRPRTLGAGPAVDTLGPVAFTVRLIRRLPSGATLAVCP